MPLQVKDAAVAARKFVSRGQAAGADYTEGVRGAGQHWQSSTAASVENYNAGVQAAIGRNAFASGVAKAGAARYETRAAGVGAQRFPQGIAQAGPEWQDKTSPYLGVLAALTLPPRRPKGDPGNFARVQAVGDALRRRKVGG